MSAIVRFLRRWGGYLALVIVFAIACALLSNWQWDRRAEAVAAIQRVVDNYDAKPVAVDTVLPELDSWKLDDEWTPVTLTGRYLRSEQALVRNRPLEGNPGWEVLVPLQLDDGRVFLVDRGWISVGDKQDLPDSIPAAPKGEVTVVARLKASEPTIGASTSSKGQLATIHLPTVAEHLGDRPTYTGAYGLLASESPSAATPTLSKKPDPDEGPHLSYALQWIAFGILAFVGLVWAVRRERRIAREEAAERAGIPKPEPKRPKRLSDADIEDELLDSVR
ncbi:hypothetical protein GCM10027515_22320 [Schumannella luteola]|uniref:SURF1-like protein n=1 Tax=Schumannella luteola TaxID=472059 RepID=A0A852YDW0_9MICO|nr:SURF1 family protein [Schumannella luteola]NYG99972.1 cytochrome oxidase assembly protein ShyY1 [Schumannella luteola]TPX05485.1 SURF1 family protein [Schumannella luteola]